MIIWLASYPKSGNTWVRLFLDSLLNSIDNNVDINNIKIRQFPLRYDFDGLDADIDNVQEFVSNCILSQDKINIDDSIKIFKTHNAFWKAGPHAFTNEKNTQGVIHIVRDPRNVVTSISNHYTLSIKESLKFMMSDTIIGNKKSFEEIGINENFVQDNQSISSTGVLRGLHFQNPPFAQAKLVSVIKGSVLDVAVDLRINYTTYVLH